MARSSRFRPASLRARLDLLAATLFALVLISVGLAALMVRSWDHSLDRRSDARVAAAHVAQLRFAYSDQETGLRGYALSGDPVSLEPYRSGSELAGQALAELRAHAPMITGLEGELDDVRAAADEWRSIAFPDPDGPVVADDRAHTAFDELRAELDELDALVDRELGEYVEAADRARSSTFGVLFASAAIALGAAFLVALLFRRWITTPLAEISAAAARLADDDQSTLPLYGAPELDRLSTTITGLQRSLAGARDRAITAYAGLEQSAVLALHVRAELAHELGDLPAGWQIDSLLVPAEGVVAGDCYDVGLLDPSRIYVVLIDVTGHGATAALDALKSKSQLRAALRSRLSPGAALAALGRESRRDGGGDMLTAIVAVFDTATGRIDYASAGHPPLLLTDGDRIERYGPTGPLIGAFDATWSTETLVIPPGWTAFLHTDGITDGVGPDRERFGDERLDDCLLGDHLPGPLVERVRAGVESFRVGPRSDDVTALALHRPIDAHAAPHQARGDAMDTVRA